MKKSKEKQLYAACCTGNYNNVKKLLKEGANPNCKIDNWYPIERASFYGYYRIAKLLIKYETNIHVHNENSLRLSIYHGYWKTTKILLECGADLEEAIKYEPELIPRIKENIDKIFDDKHERSYWKLRSL